MKYVLAPSILSADFKILGSDINETAYNGAEYLHYDVMDGMFVQNISFGIPVLKSIRPGTDMVIDAHLMVEEPIRYVEAFREAGADIITVHYEACEDLMKTLETIKASGAECGVVINPDTPVEVLKDYLGIVDMILVMSVFPGKGGQKFIPESLDRIREVRRMVEESGREIDIEVDGGVGLGNLEALIEAGANIFVAGSAVFNGDIAENTKRFVEIMAKYE